MPIEDEKKLFTEIYNKESDAVFRYCLIRVSDREKALDITQEAFARLWTSMLSGKSRGREHARSFLFVVARNLIIDWYRRSKSVSLEGLSTEEVEFDPRDEKADKAIEISSDGKRALAVIDQLDPQYREVVYFRFVQDLLPKEIGEILGLNANTVSIRLTRGVEELRKILGIKKHE